MGKKILFFINRLFGGGGAGKMLKYVSSLCAENGYNVSIAVLYNNNEKYDGLNEKIKVIDVGIKNKGVVSRGVSLFRIRKIVYLYNPDIVCSFNSDVAFSVRLATLGIKNVLFCAAERSDPYIVNKIWKILYKWTYKYTNYCFFQLEGAMHFYMPNAKDKSYIIPNPYLGENNKCFHNINSNLIVSLGRLEKQKGYDILIKSFYYVHQKYAQYQLFIYGEGPQRSELESLIKELGLEKTVFLSGFIKEPSQILKKSFLYVLSSQYEGMPNALIEAMALGIPTISTDCTPGGPAFLTNNGKRGLLVKKNDVNELSESIVYLIENKEFAHNLGKKGTEIAELLNPKRIDTLWLNAFHDIIDKNNL